MLSYEARADAYLELARNAGAEITNIEAEIARIAETPNSVLPQDADQGVLDVLIVQSRAALDESSAQRTQIAERIAQLPTEIATARARVETLTNGTFGTPDALQSAQLGADRARLRMLETELSTLATRQGVILVRQQFARAAYEQLRDIVTVQKLALNEDKLARVRTFSENVQASIQTRTKANALNAFDTETLARLAQLEDIISETSGLNVDASLIERQNQRLERSSETVARVLAVQSPDTETITLLRRIRDSLPPLRELQSRLTESETVLNELELRSVLWSEQLDELSEFQADALKNDPGTPSEAATDQQSVLRELLYAVRRDAERRTRYNLELSDNLRLSTSLQTDLERRLLWIRSREDSVGNWLVRTPAGFGYIVSPTNWDGAFRAVLNTVTTKPLLTLIWVLFLSLFWIGRPRVKLASLRLATRVNNLERDAYWVTPAAIIIDGLYAIAGPITLVAASALVKMADSGLDVSLPQRIFTDNLATSLRDVGVLLFFMLLFIRMARPRGTLSTHFGWSEGSRGTVSKHLRWFTPLLCIAVGIIGLTRDTTLPSVDNGLALVTFILISLALATLAWMFLNPKSRLYAKISSRRSGSPLLRLGLVAAVAAPLVVGLLPLLGWIDTAQELQARVFASGFWCMMVALLYSLMYRTIRVAEQRYDASRQRRLIAETLSNDPSKQDIVDCGEAVPLPPEVPETMDATDRLRDVLPWFSAVILASLFWLEWHTLVPAFGILDDIVLWSSQSVIDGELTPHPTTVSTVLVSVVIFAGSVFVAKNAKNLFELAAGRGIRMETGTQYAAATLFGYSVIGVGVVTALGILGLDWSKLQWIVAALGVGLGFGLQEIVANFVSGIIILFERPVRVGDIVTINNLSGTVRDVRIRATMITDFDNRDILLPNKSIITGEVTNWTLHDSVTRLVIPIGVAYGSDIDAVQQLLANVIENEPEILSLPVPTVFMSGHGDSSLDFELRVFVATPLQRIPVTHSLNAAMNVALKTAGIEIPFPQRDVWNRTAVSDVKVI